MFHSYCFLNFMVSLTFFWVSWSNSLWKHNEFETVVCPLFHLPFPPLPSGFSPFVYLLTLKLKKLLQFWANAGGTVTGSPVLLYITVHWLVHCIASIRSLICPLMANTPVLLMPKYYCFRCCQVNSMGGVCFTLKKLFKGAQRGWPTNHNEPFSYFVFWCINC